jgi:hypothetical protein
VLESAVESRKWLVFKFLAAVNRRERWEEENTKEMGSYL